MGRGGFLDAKIFLVNCVQGGSLESGDLQFSIALVSYTAGKHTDNLCVRDAKADDDVAQPCLQKQKLHLHESELASLARSLFLSITLPLSTHTCTHPRLQTFTRPNARMSAQKHTCTSTRGCGCFVVASAQVRLNSTKHAQIPHLASFREIDRAYLLGG